MLCLKRHHLVLTLSLLALFVVPFLFSSGRAYASSYTFNYDSSSDPKPQQVYWTADNSYNGLTFTPTYVVIEGVATRNDTQISVAKVSPYAFSSYSPVYIVPDSDLHFFVVLNMSWGLQGQWSNISSITYSFYDFNPASSEPCPDCPDCPPIPETPYGDILNKIYIAILAVSATALCIYFFYAFYNMFFGGIKR